MKRGGPLQRLTPLVARTELRNRTELARGGPLNPVSAKRQRDNAQRTKVVNGLRMLQRGICPRCRRGDAPLFGHEVLARAHGGNIVAPEVALCCVCNDAIEDAPRVSTWNGWKASPKWPTDPLLEPGAARDLFGNIVVFADLAAAFGDAS